MGVDQASAGGRVIAIWRYPIKSMLGEELEATLVTDRGLVGDRSFALVDAETGKVASAKNPRRWPNLFDFRSAYATDPQDGQTLPPVKIRFPDGDTLTTDQPDIEAELSTAVGRTVRLARTPPASASAEGYWPDHDWLSNRDEVFEFQFPSGTFFDGSNVHLLTTTSLETLSTIAPASQFDPRRFRPNFVIEPAQPAEGFLEDDWIGKTMALGEVRLQIERPCPRCVMTTLPQRGLPKDPAILRTAVQSNHGNVGVYALVLQGGRVRKGDVAAIV